MSDKAIEVLLDEKRTFPPPKPFKKSANAKSQSVFNSARKNPQAFWAKAAKELEWFKPWKKVLEWDSPWAKWFIGGKINASYNCLDRHVKSGRKNKAAIIWEGEPGDERVLTYRDVWREVNKFANVLKKLGVKKGDRVCLYMGMVPELVIAMHACNRIGAPHSVVFGGFSAEALRDRINDAQAKVLITADGGYRRGALCRSRRNADEALTGTPSIEHAVVVKRVGDETGAHMKEGRDHWWDELMADAPLWCEPEKMDSEDILFLLYTSGTTGKPKGIVHTTGGYLTGVHLANKWIFDMKEDDVFWCAADIGWVTGHTHIVYGPMANGVTQVMYEGTPDWPDKERLWRIVEKYGVTIFHTAPTAIRTFMRWGTEFPGKHDLKSLRLLGDRWRADQSGSLGLVSQIYWRRTLSGDGYLVADRDRPSADHAFAGSDEAQAGLGDFAVSGHRSRYRRRAWKVRSQGWRRLSGSNQALAGDDANHLRRSGSFRANLLEPIPRQVFCG